jgi:hypothetical protein
VLCFPVTDQLQTTVAVACSALLDIFLLFNLVSCSPNLVKERPQLLAGKSQPRLKLWIVNVNSIANFVHGVANCGEIILAH